LIILYEFTKGHVVQSLHFLFFFFFFFLLFWVLFVDDLSFNLIN